MSYRVVYSKKALKQLKKLDTYTRSSILLWIDNHLEGTDNPRQQGKGLTANRSGEWRYRVGIYRVLAEIQEHEIVIKRFAFGRWRGFSHG